MARGGGNQVRNWADNSVVSPSKTAGCEHQAHGGAARIDTRAAAGPTTQKLVGVSRPSGNLGFFVLRWDFWVALVTSHVGCSVEDHERWVPGETQSKIQIPAKKNTAHVYHSSTCIGFTESAHICRKKKQGHVIGKLHFCRSRYLGQTVRRGSVTRKKQWRATGTHSTMTAVMPE